MTQSINGQLRVVTQVGRFCETILRFLGQSLPECDPRKGRELTRNVVGVVLCDFVDRHRKCFRINVAIFQASIAFQGSDAIV